MPARKKKVAHRSKSTYTNSEEQGKLALLVVIAAVLLILFVRYTQSQPQTTTPSQPGMEREF